ncbi:MAG: RidA family protein [Chitinophagaceae bacterium]
MERRKSLQQILKGALGLVGVGILSKSWGRDAESPQEKTKTVGTVMYKDDVPLFSSVIRHGDLVFVAGIGAHFKGDIKSHTDHVLTELEKVLKSAGSSMEKVLKASVFLHDLDDYDGMNEVFKGRFGEKPPVRTTVAVGGVPGASLVEIDVIAYV